MKYLIVAIALMASAAQAGTVYRDRPFPVPSGAPCFVKFNAANVNASHIRDVTVGEHNDQSRIYPSATYLSLRVTFISGSIMEARGTDVKVLRSMEEAFLQSIKDCNK